MRCLTSVGRWFIVFFYCSRIEMTAKPNFVNLERPDHPDTSSSPVLDDSPNPCRCSSPFLTPEFSFSTPPPSHPVCASSTKKIFPSICNGDDLGVDGFMVLPFVRSAMHWIYTCVADSDEKEAHVVYKIVVVFIYSIILFIHV